MLTHSLARKHSACSQARASLRPPPESSMLRLAPLMLASRAHWLMSMRFGPHPQQPLLITVPPHSCTHLNGAKHFGAGASLGRATGPRAASCGTGAAGRVARGAAREPDILRAPPTQLPRVVACEAHRSWRLSRPPPAHFECEPVRLQDPECAWYRERRRRATCR